MRDDFAVIIPSYDRYDSLKENTLSMLKRYNYSGKWYVVVDDSDPQLERYKENIPEEHLFIFNKQDYYNYYDTCHNNKKIDAKIYALGYIDSIINKLNLNYYYILDDDKRAFMANGEDSNINIELLFNFLIEIMDNAKNIDCLGFMYAFGYTYVSDFSNKDIIRYDMSGNYFFRRNHKMKFMFHLNDEKCTIIKNSEIGRLMFIIRLPDIRFGLDDGIGFYYLQKDDYTGGCSSQYTFFGKDFYSYKYIEILAMLMVRPNYFTYIKLDDKIKTSGHHKAPKIIDERWKK